ncbi:histidine kinase [Lachnospiraceae bacterium OttesenSCG-928-D06]|nr:histidine kinase [Lachnospiraceae bacterium OttesenSCG-928-D06]
MKRKKPYSINRNLIGIIMIIFIGLSGTLGFYSYYSLASYYKDVEMANVVSYKQYLDKIESLVISTDDFIMDISLNNRDFSTLKTLKKDAGLYRYVASYNLMTVFQMKMASTEGLSGLVLAYDEEAAFRYLFTKGIDYDERNELVQYVKENRGEYLLDWELAKTEEKTYLIKLAGNENACLAGIIDFVGETAGHYDNVDSGVEFIFMQGEQILNSDDSSLQGRFIQALGENRNQEEFSEEMIPFQDGIDFYMNEYFVVGSRVNTTNLYMYMLIPNRQFAQLRISQVMLLLILIIACMSIPFIYFLLKKKLSSPINHLVVTMDEIKNGNMDVIIEDVYQIEEFENVYGTFHDMMAEIKELRIETYEKEIEKQRAELQYLQLQIKPHYYLNGLKTLNALCIQQKYNEMQDLIIGISKHLRYMFRDISMLVTLEEELEHVRKYLELQTLVSSIPFEYVLDVEPTVFAYKVPPFTIQTFIENSFKYGNKNGEKLKLVVKGVELETENGNFLDLTIRDNGLGYPEVLLASLNRKEPEVYDSQHIGIVNLKARSRLLYELDTEYVFMNNGGAISEIIIPKSQTRKEDCNGHINS